MGLACERVPTPTGPKARPTATRSQAGRRTYRPARAAVGLWGGMGPTLRFLAARARVEAVSPP